MFQKKTLDFAGLTAERTVQYQLNNTVESIEKLANKLVSVDYKGKIICESTGHYHLKLVSVFSKHKLNLYVINPLLSSKHSQANIRKTKTEPVDAKTLATMCLTERNLPKPTLTNDRNLLITLKVGQIKAMEKLIQKMRGSLRLYEETYQGLGFDRSEIQHGLSLKLAELKSFHKRMLKELEDLIIEENNSSNDTDILNSIPGISSTTVALLSQLDRNVQSCHSWVAFIGLDTSIRQSGTWKGKGKLSKRGNTYLRKRMFCAAWGAMLHDDKFRAYYDRLRAEGRDYKEALCILAKKQIRVAYHLLSIGEKYDPNKAFCV
ncbi:mobile element protein [Vibrio ishigakensis]|uniref:Mobile element protein n=1 Tax=Vibrio ishigakensis TaxID=1481914 RepID=A0A0B8P554_9VIBR|nr:transposase [Vibrio ishigakensis]GAM58109.1 mobile element protein [Vibrio ishigakensis]